MPARSSERRSAGWSSHHASVSAAVVASGYHRNLAGIKDSWRVLTSRSFAEAEPVLRAAEAVYLVASSPEFAYQR